MVVLPCLRGGYCDPDGVGTGAQFALSVALERVGWTVADPALALQILGGSASPATPARGRQVAEELGVARYVTGNVTEVAGRVLLSARVASVADVKGRIHASVDGDEDEFFELVRDLAETLKAGTP